MLRPDLDFRHDDSHEDVWVLHSEWAAEELALEMESPPSGDVFWFGFDPVPFDTMTLYDEPGRLFTVHLVEMFLDCLERDELIGQTGMGFDTSCGDLESCQEAKKCAEAIFNLTRDLLSGEPAPDDFSQAVAEYDHCLDQARKDEAMWAKYAGTLEPLENGPRDATQDPFAEPLTDQQEILWKHLFLSLAQQSLGMCEEGMYRLLQLSKLVRQSTASQPTLAFLRRVSRCYVWGFDSECVILCRSALEMAFREAMPDDLCAEVDAEAAADGDNLYSRIRSAHRKMRISDSIRNAAERVRVRGNKAVHYDPHAVKEVWETIQDTLAVIQALNGHRA